MIYTLLGSLNKEAAAGRKTILACASDLENDLITRLDVKRVDLA